MYTLISFKCSVPRMTFIEATTYVSMQAEDTRSWHVSQTIFHECCVNFLVIGQLLGHRRGRKRTSSSISADQSSTSLIHLFYTLTAESLGSYISEGVALGIILVAVVAWHFVSKKPSNPSSWPPTSHQSGVDIPRMRQVIEQNITSVSIVRSGFYPMISQDIRSR